MSRSERATPVQTSRPPRYSALDLFRKGLMHADWPRSFHRHELRRSHDAVIVGDGVHGTHGRVLVRLTGDDAGRALADVCAVNLADSGTPDGTAFRTAVASVTTDVVRDDRNGTRSYLLHCERSSDQSLAEALLDARAEFGAEAVGLAGRRP